MSSVVVRRLGPEDWRDLRATRLAALTDAPEAFITTLEQAQACTDRQWQDRILRSPHFLAHFDAADPPVGKAVGYLHHGLPELVGMWVAPQARGRAVVEALISAVAGWARDIGHDVLVLWVVEGNERAERAYRRCGFVRTGLSQPVPGRPAETEVQMSLSLAATAR